MSRYIEAGRLSFLGRRLAQSPSQSKLEGWRLNESTEREPPVLELTPLVTCLATGSRGMMNVAHSSVTLILILASFTAGPERLHLAIRSGDGQDLTFHFERLSKADMASRADDLLGDPALLDTMFVQYRHAD